jgi:CBS domain-containing protein
MDRRFVTLKATDTQASAVEVFRREDRTALPVTDAAGVLIGIVTVDDVLDVAEAVATREFQLFGGSEALDQPYLEISAFRMVCIGSFGASSSQGSCWAAFSEPLDFYGFRSGRRSRVSTVRIGHWWR